MSFELAITPRQRAGSRLISSVRKQFVLAADEQGATQQAIADKMEVNRSVINRLLRGTANLTVRTIGELAWALNLEVIITLRRKKDQIGTNLSINAAPDWKVMQSEISSSGSNPGLRWTAVTDSSSL